MVKKRPANITIIIPVCLQKHPRDFLIFVSGSCDWILKMKAGVLNNFKLSL